jgi:signal transduction histidine kinase
MRWSDRTPRKLRSLRELWGTFVAAVLIAATGTGAAVVFHGWWHHSIDAQNADRLDRAVTSRAGRISDNLTRYLDALRAVGALQRTGTGAGVGKEQFEAFARGLDLPRRYTAMQAIGWQVPVTAPHLASVVSGLRQSGQSHFTVTPAGRRDRYALLVYQSATEPVTSVPGTDLRADPGMSAVLDHTGDTGEPALAPAAGTGDPSAATYLLLLPIYQPGNIANLSVAQRRAELIGWVSARIHTDRFLTESLSGIAAGNAGVQLFDNDLPHQIAVDPQGFHASGPDTRTVRIPVAGRLWNLRVAPLPGSALVQDANPTASIGLAGGIALSVLLAAMMIMISAQARTTRALRTANRRSTDMVAMLSHDARQPLTTIINYSELVLEDWRHLVNTSTTSDQQHPAVPPGTSEAHTDADIPASLGRVIGAAHRLNNLVDDVLATARLDAIPTHNPRPVLVGQLIAEAISDSGAFGMLVDTTAVQTVWAHTDPTHLRQIIANLVGNALKYGAPPVTITADIKDHEVLIEIGDTGPGVPAEFVHRLFDRFTRAATTGTHGSGFGLYIAQRLAEANNGHIRYRPRQPAGACFALTVPAADLTPHRDSGSRSTTNRKEDRRRHAE